MFGRRKKRREELEPQLMEIVRLHLQRRGIERSVGLDEALSEEGLGFDSVARLELLTAVEERCGVRIPEAYWGTRPVESLRHLLDILCS